MFPFFCPPLSVLGSVGGRPDPALLLQEATSQLAFPGGDAAREPGAGVLRGALLTGGGHRDLPDPGEDGTKPTAAHTAGDYHRVTLFKHILKQSQHHRPVLTQRGPLRPD